MSSCFLLQNSNNKLVTIYNSTDYKIKVNKNNYFFNKQISYLKNDLYICNLFKRKMKNNLFKIYILSFLLLSDFIMFAQPGDDDGGGGLEGDDPPPTPINGKLIWLGIVALLFAIYSFKKNKKVA